MAIVKCPECGKEISTNASQCVHCGSPFTVCPDCNTVLAGTPETCPACGCALKKIESVQPKKASQTAETEQTPLAEEEKLRRSFDRVVKSGNHIEKSIKVAGIVLGVFSAIFLIVCAIVVWLWRDDLNSSNPLILAPRLLSFPKDCEMMRAFLSLACIGGIVEAIYGNASKIAFRKAYTNMVKEIDADKNKLLVVIHKYYTDDPSLNGGEQVGLEEVIKSSEKYIATLDTCYEIFFPERRSKAIIFAVILSILAVLNGIFIGIAVDKLLITDFYRARLLDVPYELDYGWLIGVGVCIILYAIVSVILRRDGKRKEWIDKNLA